MNIKQWISTYSFRLILATSISCCLFYLFQINGDYTTFKKVLPNIPTFKKVLPNTLNNPFPLINDNFGDNAKLIKRLTEQIYDLKNKDPENNLQCILPKIDPFNSEFEHVYTKKDQNKENNKKETNDNSQMCDKILTSLIDGVLKIDQSLVNLSNSETCKYRCLYPYPTDDFKIIEGKWNNIDKVNGSRPECDIVEVRCKDYWFEYRNIHTQIVEKLSAEADKENDLSKYNFYWIVLDSTASSMFKRMMPKTRQFLMEKLGAVEFSYLNKIGPNSRANAYGMFFGEQTVGIESEKPENSTNTVRTWEEFCPLDLTDFNFVGFDFKKAGYMTAMSDDFSIGLMNWLNCTGFKRPPVHHYMHPFWQKIGIPPLNHNDKILTDQMLRCKSPHTYILDHLKKFSNSYRENPKFALLWATQLAHNDNSALFDADQEFTDFFDQFTENAKNSFVFMQGDHGIKFGPSRDVPVVGEIEENNPFFYVIVPKELRENPSFMSQIKENSKHLVSHFDLYASAVQIAKFSHGWDSTTNFNQLPKSIEDRKLLGSSIFHKINQPRTCDDLNVPWKYCMCYKESITLNEPQLAKKVAQKIVDMFNDQLTMFGFGDRCLNHTLSSGYLILLEEFKQKNDSGFVRVLRVKFETLPGKALYQGLVEVVTKDSSISIFHKYPLRLNTYSTQANCIEEGSFRNYCVCKDSIK